MQINRLHKKCGDTKLLCVFAGAGHPWSHCSTLVPSGPWTQTLIFHVCDWHFHLTDWQLSHTIQGDCAEEIRISPHLLTAGRLSHIWELTHCLTEQQSLSIFSFLCSSFWWLILGNKWGTTIESFPSVGTSADRNWWQRVSSHFA